MSQRDKTIRALGTFADACVVPRGLLALLDGDADAAIMIVRVLQLGLRSQTGWVPMSAEDWERDINFRRTKVLRAGGDLERLGYIDRITKRVENSGLVKVHYRVTGLFVDALLSSMPKIVTSERKQDFRKAGFDTSGMQETCKPGNGKDPQQIPLLAESKTPVLSKTTKSPPTTPSLESVVEVDLVVKNLDCGNRGIVNGAKSAVDLPPQKPDSAHEFMLAWNRECGTLPKCKGLTAERRVKCKKRLSERPLSEWIPIMQEIARNGFLTGDNDRGWVATFDWLIRSPESALRVVEGKYVGLTRSKNPPAPGEDGYEEWIAKVESEVCG